MLRSPAALPKPRASLPVSGVSSRMATVIRTTALPTRPRSATPSTTYTHTRLPTPSAPLSTQRGSRRRSSTIGDDRMNRAKPVVTPLPRLAQRENSDIATPDIPSARFKQRGAVRASDTPTLSRDRARSRTSPPRSVDNAAAYPTPPYSGGPSASRCTTYQSATVSAVNHGRDMTPTHTLRTQTPAKAPPSHSRALPSATLPLKIRRRTQTSSTRAVRWRPRSPSPGVLLLMDDISRFQDEWTQLFSDAVFEHAWTAFLDAHVGEYGKYVEIGRHDPPKRLPQPARRESVPASLRAVSLRPTLAVELDEEKLLRRKSPVVDIFSMLSRDARPAGRSNRLSSPPRIPLPEIPDGPSRARWSKDSIVSSSSTVRSSTISRRSTFSASLDSARASYASTAPTTSASQEVVASDSNTSLYSVDSTFTEVSSSPPSDKALRRNAMLPVELLQSIPLHSGDASPLGLVGIPHGYDMHGPRSSEEDSYSTNQAFTLTDSPLALSEYTSPIPVESAKVSHSRLSPPIGGSLRGTSGPRSRNVTASLANSRTPLENPRRPPLRSASLQVQPQKPLRSGLLRGQVHRMFDRHASDSESVTSKSSLSRRYTDTESLKSRISGPVVSVAGVAVDGLDHLVDLRDLSVEEEDGSVYDENVEVY
ncbi:hypothetical protein PENSPDRAFT_756653 [Peniophora sp. CONT]|nr:hypothetical protein PENSPDRAFT_756653 [Peniophora sp. CONT]